MVAPNGSIAVITDQNTAPGPVGNGPALTATLSNPTAIVADTSGNVYLTDPGNYAVRVLTLEGGPPVLTVSCTPGILLFGSAGQYSLTVSNLSLAGATSGTVTVTDLLPDGLTLESMTGDGWGCTANQCTRGDALASGASYPPIVTTVNVTATVPSQVTNLVTVSGGSGVPSGVQNAAAISTPITVQTNPASLFFQVDGLAPQTGPQVLDLTWGLHTVAVASPVSGPPGTRYMFNGWSDDGALSHTIVVNNAPASYIANFQTQYQLTTQVLPAFTGSVTPETGGYFSSGATVTLTATPAGSAPFNFWSGGVSGISNPVTLTMNAATTVTADFFACDVTQSASAYVSDLQYLVNQALGTAAAVDDLNRDGVVNVGDIQMLIGLVLGTACVY